MNSVPITVSGIKKLRELLAHLKSVERPAIVQAIADARAQGDISENAEYESAKEKQSFIEGRIMDIESKLSNALIVDPSTLQQDGRVVFGVWVEVKDEAKDQTQKFQIVGEDEADSKYGLISYKSPMARLLISKAVGDEVEFVTPGGIKLLEILDVRYAPWKTKLG